MTGAREALARLHGTESGKAPPDARSEIAYATKVSLWYAEEAVRWAASSSTPHWDEQDHGPAPADRCAPPHHAMESPAAMATRNRPALAAGCSVILKPASETPLTGLAIVAILAEAGVPDGVVSAAMELGGNAPFVVLPDADLDEAVARPIPRPLLANPNLTSPLAMRRPEFPETTPVRSRPLWGVTCPSGRQRASSWPSR